MAKNKISEYSSTAANNTDIAGINIAEGCAPSGINNAIRELMAQLKDQQAGTDSDSFIVGGGFTSVGAAVFSSTVAIAGATTFSSSVVMSGSVAMNGNNNIGNTTSATILSGSVTQTSSSKLYLDDSITTASAPPLSWDGDTDTGIYRPAANTMAIVTAGVDRLRVNSSGVVIIGTGEATTTVTGNILRAPSSAGTNIAGSDFEIQPGNGTGTGGSGRIIIKTADVGSSGAGANTLTQRLLITPKGGFSFGTDATSYGTAGQVLKSNGDAPPTFGSAITSATAQTAPPSIPQYFEFTGIPSWAKRITIMLSGVSTNGTSALLAQVGTSAGIVATGYLGSADLWANSPAPTLVTQGLGIGNQNAAAYVYQAVCKFTNITSNTWVGEVIGTLSSSGIIVLGTTTIALSGTLDRVRITTVGGVNTFDAGSINIIYE
jgi:hypothetical protein